MKISAYREACAALAQQTIADYELHRMLTPTDTTSEYYNAEDPKWMVAFAQRLNEVLDTREILAAASLSGPPIVSTPPLVNYANLAGVNEFSGLPGAKPLDAPAAPAPRNGEEGGAADEADKADEADEALVREAVQDLIDESRVSRKTLARFLRKLAQSMSSE